MFQSATFRLTMWYLAIIMVISGIFSVAIYDASTSELRGSLRRQATMYQGLPWYRGGVGDDSLVGSLDKQLEAAQHRLKINLVLLNLAILAGAGAGGYWLARRTLTPIEDAMEAQSRFTADASHELRTPLTAMRTEIEVALRDGRLTAAEAKELLQSNLEEISKLENLSTGLLKLAQNNGQLELVPVAAPQVAGLALARWQKAADHKGVTIVVDLKPVSVLADEQNLVELVSILLDNAIKYSSAGAEVEVTSGVRGRFGFIAVRDHGPGIKAEAVSRIFDRFFRADTSRTKSHVNGYGLGLSIAKQIAEAHHGSIEVESLIGKGSRFMVLVPMLPSQDIARARA